MTTAQHTPGPWKVRSFVGSHTPRRAEISAPVGHREVCAVYWHIVDGTREAAEANARLIAASPRMLAALRKVHDFLDKHGNGWDEAEALDEVRAAIGEATGARS